MRRGINIWTAGTIVCLAAIGCGPAAGAPGQAQRSVGKKLPVLVLHGLTGESEAKQLDDIKNKVTVLHFWGTWCPPCVKEFPKLEKLQADHGENARFLLLAISSGEEVDTDLNELRGTTQQFLDKHKYTVPQFADKDDQTRTAVERLCGWAGYPCTVVLQDGTVRGVWLELGAKTSEEIDGLVTELLAK